jgi:PhzF family phenazine biosynthesis protein
MNGPGRSVQVHVVNAFTHLGAGGNPAAVVLQADKLSAPEKQALARRMGLSETAFVSRLHNSAADPGAERADLRLEFFTPLRQIAQCGHATVAALGLMHQLEWLPARAVNVQTVDGLHKVEVQGDRVFLHLPAPTFDDTRLAPLVEGGELASSLGLPIELLKQGPDPACIGSCGNRFLLLGLPNPQALLRVQASSEKLAALCEGLDLVGVYVYALLHSPEEAGTGADAAGPQPLATARMFAPRFGIDEEAATGMAAAPLACWLWQRGHAHRACFDIEQGRFMGSPSISRLTVQLRLVGQGRSITGAAVGGHAAPQHLQTLALDRF